MADLKIVADYSDIQVMRRELVGVAKDAKASASVFEREYAKVEKQQKASLNAVKRQLAFSKRMEAQKAREAKVSASAAAAVAKEEERLKNKFVEGYTAMNIYSKEMNDLALARKKGLISTKEQTAAVASLNAQMKAGTGAFANAATGMQIVGKRANRAGVLAQQAGYQFGDFAVQVQSGTNVFVAFGQQATQLVGTFSMLAKSTKMIGLFAGLGVAIPVLTGIAAAFMRTKERAKEAEVQLKSTSEMLKELRGSASDAAKELRVLLGTFKDIADLDTFLKVESIKEEIASVTLALESAKKATGRRASGQDALQDKIDLLELEKQDLITANEKRIANEKLLEIEKSYRELMGEINEEAQKELDAAEELADKRKESQAAFQDQIIAQSNLLALLEIEKDLGKDHSDYRAELIFQEEARLRKLVEQKEITESQAKDALYLYEETLKVNGELEASANSANNLAAALKEAASAMSSLSSFGAGLDKAIAVAAAKVNALKTGADEAVAGRIAGLRADLEVKLSAKGLRPEAVPDLRAEAEGKISTLEGYLTKGSALRSSQRASGGSKKSPAEELQEYLDKLKNQSELERKLVGLFGEKRNTEEEVIKARQKYGEVFGKSQEAELRGTLAQREAEKERQRVLEEAKQQQEEVASVIADNFGSAFMSIVDGTKTAKEAFKDMARSIIKQLFQILVVEKMVKSIKSFISPSISAAEANGGAWQGGSKIQAYADGGVVGGPTYFPMAGGKTGLMGEAGPEAIMPLKRGANGKLGVQAEGGGSSTTVIQNNTFGSGVTRAEVNAMLPKMVEATKAAVADAKLRGGSYGGAFA